MTTALDMRMNVFLNTAMLCVIAVCLMLPGARYANRRTLFIAAFVFVAAGAASFAGRYHADTRLGNRSIMR